MKENFCMKTILHEEAFAQRVNFARESFQHNGKKLNNLVRKVKKNKKKQTKSLKSLKKTNKI